MTQNNEREAVVRWLRSESAYRLASQSEHGDLLLLADAIHRGYHLENTNDTN